MASQLLLVAEAPPSSSQHETTHGNSLDQSGRATVVMDAGHTVIQDIDTCGNNANAGSRPSLFSLPRELRDEIYPYTFLNEQVK